MARGTLTLPHWFPFLQYAQLALAVIIFAVSIYPLHKTGSLGGPLPFTLFVSIWTIVFIAYLMLTARSFSHAYSTRLDLGLQGATMAFWLVQWTWMAALVASMDNPWSDSSNPVEGTSIAVTVLGAVEWLLFVATFGLMARSFIGHHSGILGGGHHTKNTELGSTAHHHTTTGDTLATSHV